MVNRYYQGREYQPELYAPPVDVVAKALLSAQARFTANKGALDELGSKYIEALPQDRARAAELEQSLRSRISDITNKYQGDFSQADRDLEALKRDVNSMFSPNGEAGAIQRNYSLVQDSLKRERARLAKGEIDQTQMALLNKYYEGLPATSFDPATKQYSQVAVEDLPSTYDVYKNFSEYASKVKPRIQEQTYPTGRKTLDGYTEFLTTKTSKIDKQEVIDGYMGVVNNDPQYQAYIASLEKLSGVPARLLQADLLNQYASNVIPSFTGTFEDSQKLDYKENWLERANLNFAHDKAMEAIRHRNALGRINYQHELKKQDEVGDLHTAQLKITTPAQQTKYDEIPQSRYTPTYGRTGNILDAVLLREDKVPMTYNWLMTTKSTEFKVNKEMLQSIKVANPKATDAEIIDMYNSKVNSIQSMSQLNYVPFETTNSQQEEANRLLPGLLNGAYRVWEYNDNTGSVNEVVNQDDRIKLGRSMQQRRSNGDVIPNGKASVGSLGKAMAFTGHGIPSGASIIPDPNGSGKLYFVANPRTDISNMNANAMDKAFSFIRKNKSLGDYFEVQDKKTGSGFGIVGTREYDNGEPVYTYYAAKQGADGTAMPNYNEPITVGNRKATPADIERLLMSDETFKSTFPHKTESQYNAEFLTDN